MKTELITSIMVQHMGTNAISAQQISLIDRCTKNILQPYLHRRRKTAPTLMDWRKELLKQDCPEAHDLALAAALVDKPLLLPPPWSVLRRLGELAATAAFWLTVARTLGRIALGLVGGVTLGTLLAAATARFRPLRVLFSPLLTVVQSTPVASFILLLLVWLGRDTLPAVVVALMVLPVAWRNVSAGVQSADPLLLELARVYRFPCGRVLRRIYIPSVEPYFLAALETALGLAWKAGVAAEVLTVPKGSVGTMLYEAKLYLETTDLFAWTVTVIACSLAIEALLAAALRRLEKGGAGDASAA